MSISVFDVIAVAVLGIACIFETAMLVIWAHRGRYEPWSIVGLAFTVTLLVWCIVSLSSAR